MTTLTREIATEPPAIPPAKRVRRPATPAADLADKAIAEIEKRGWARTWIDDAGAVCAMGAINVAAGMNASVTVHFAWENTRVHAARLRLIDALAASLRRPEISHNAWVKAQRDISVITQWNDTKATKMSVLRRFAQVAKELREAGL